MISDFPFLHVVLTRLSEVFVRVINYLNSIHDEFAHSWTSWAMGHGLHLWNELLGLRAKWAEGPITASPFNTFPLSSSYMYRTLVTRSMEGKSKRALYSPLA